MKRDYCPQSGCTKYATGRKRSGNRCIEEVCQIQRFVIQQATVLFRWLSRLLVSWRTTLIVCKRIGSRMTFSTADPQEKRRLCRPTGTFCSDSTPQRHVSSEYFHFRSVVAIADIISVYHLFHHQHR